MIRLPHPCFTPHPSKHTVPFLSPDTSTLHRLAKLERERGKETARLLLLQLQPRRANTRNATCPAAKPPTRPPRTTTAGEGARPCPRAISRKGGVGREKAPPRFAFPRSAPRPRSARRRPLLSATVAFPKRIVRPGRRSAGTPGGTRWRWCWCAPSHPLLSAAGGFGIPKATRVLCPCRVLAPGGDRGPPRRVAGPSCQLRARAPATVTKRVALAACLCLLGPRGEGGPAAVNVPPGRGQSGGGLHADADAVVGWALVGSGVARVRARVAGVTGTGGRLGVEGTRRDGRHAHATARHGTAAQGVGVAVAGGRRCGTGGCGCRIAGKGRAPSVVSTFCAGLRVRLSRVFISRPAKEKPVGSRSLVRPVLFCSSTTCAIARYSTRRSAASHHHSPLGGAVAVAVVESEAADMNILAQQRRQRTGQRIDLLNTPARHELARS
jgi:hypothetical protein